RECARLDCNLVVQLPSGSTVTVVGWEHGETYNGNDIWRRILYNGDEIYVHSSLISVDRPAPTSVPVQQQVQSVPQPQQTAPQQQWNCVGDRYNCSDFSNRAELMSYWNMCPGDPSGLDGHPSNGIPCESLR
ncbi:MAG: hypothetical protein K8L99_15500, partial [Anaerolineae bacterium]|nr:hypothetical protein [Anaerolineae bacterium]